MRRVTFNLIERIVLIPVELVGLVKPSLLLLGFLTIVGTLLALVSSLFHTTPVSISKSLWVAFYTFLPILPAAFLGVILFPILLPVLPGKAFACKGAALSVLGIGVYLVGMQSLYGASSLSSILSLVPYVFLLSSIVSFLALNFTGSTPFTSLSGVLKEMRIAIPFQAGGFLVGTFWLWVDLFIKGGNL